ncbi:MAG: phosphoenolpyruvate--protein phosphotransferase [Deltaproteobacteria bacterium]|nr:MAG: phosphoenolpyruvate--protein phosphotransferase [Deltaproteobacteria bacterium]
MTAHESEQKKVLRGIGVSPGIVIGKAHLVDRSRVKIFYHYLVDEEQVEKELKRFRDALKKTEEQLLGLRNNMPEHIKQHGFIIDSHLMILKDGMLTDATEETILKEKINAEWAIRKSLNNIRKMFGEIDDEYIRNRLFDVENVTERILRNLSGEEQESLAKITNKVIIVAHELTPCDTTEMNVNKVMGFITDVGGRTSHTAIMAQALELPAVVGLETATRVIEDGDLLIVDGTTGEVIVNPDDADIIFYQEKHFRLERYKTNIAKTSHLPAETIDGHRVAVKANIEFLEEVAAVKEHGGEGIGLYRTEFLYLRCRALPTEEDLFEDYKEVARVMAPDPVTIRTLDMGGDKFAPDFSGTKETNPALGLRAIRFCLKQPEIFKQQLRAILKASAHGNIHLMFPMISGVQEILDAKRILEEVRQELDKKGEAYDPHMKVGIMIEVPSAVTMAEVLAEHVDFFSIGTNDLIQYALAIDRVNEHVAYMYQPYHPAILRMIKMVVDAGKAADIPVALCGEMAGDPLCTGILLGLGIQEFSMNPRSIPVIKKVIRALAMKDAKQDLAEVMKMSTAKEVRDYLSGAMGPKLVELGLEEHLPASQKTS